MADHDDRSIVPVDLKAHLQEVLHQFFGDLVGHEHRAVVIFPGMVAGEHDLPVVVSNFELDDVDAIVSAIGLIGPLVHEGHPIRCASLAALLGVEQAKQCSQCKFRGKVPTLQDPEATLEDRQCCQ